MNSRTNRAKPGRWAFDEKAIAFWDLVDRSAGDFGCWVWKGAVTAQHGYGCFAVGDGRVVGAHKLAWLMAHGDTKELCVLHRCDNRICVNPAHLFLGTKKDNAEDAVAKRRHAAKLNPDSVREIRGLFGTMYQKDIAKKFGVSPTVINSIAKGRRWKHVQ